MLDKLYIIKFLTIFYNLKQVYFLYIFYEILDNLFYQTIF